MKRLAALSFIVAIGLLVPVAATAHGPGMGKTKVITITMGDIYFKPASISVKAGTMVKLLFINKGKLEHEFMLGRGGFMREDGMIHGYKKDFLRGLNLSFTGTDGAEFAIEDTGTEVALEPGARAELTFMVPMNRTGMWGFGCFEPGHFQAGQHGVFIVSS